MKSRLLTKTDYRGNLVYYFGVPDIARRAGFGPYLDYIGPYISEDDARQDEQRMIREASLILLESQPELATGRWAKSDRVKRASLRLEGYEACKMGTSIEACPYPYTDRTAYYWLLGWWKRQRETNSDTLSSEILNLPQRNPRRYRPAGRKRRRSEGMSVPHITEGVTTRLYFSFDPAPGSTDTSILQEAGIDHLLLSYASSGETGGWPGVHKILCSQTPRHSLPDFDLEAYLEFIEIEQDEFDFAMSGEVPGDAEATRTLWLKTTEWLTVNLGDTPLDDWPTILPVWGWGSSLDLLDHYLRESHLVAIGGTLPFLLVGQDRGVLQDLIALCHHYQGRFHIRQCNWAAAVEQLLGLVHSIDTSMWQDGYQGTSISPDIKTGLLHMAPAAVTPDGKGLSKHALCVRNAQNLKSFAQDPRNQVVSLSRCCVCGGVFNSKGTDRKYCTPGCAVIYDKFLK